MSKFKNILQSIKCLFGFHIWLYNSTYTIQTIQCWHCYKYKTVLYYGHKK